MPCPGSLSSRISPPWAFMISKQRLNPRPYPPVSLGQQFKLLNPLFSWRHVSLQPMWYVVLTGYANCWSHIIPDIRGVSHFSTTFCGHQAFTILECRLQFRYPLLEKVILACWDDEVFEFYQKIKKIGKVVNQWLPVKKPKRSPLNSASSSRNNF